MRCRRAHCSGLTKSKGHAKFSQRICRVAESHGEPSCPLMASQGASARRLRWPLELLA